MKEKVKKLLKKFLMNFCFLILEVYSFLRKGQLKDFEKLNLKIGILFLKPLGFGDLIMLSPAIEAFFKIFPNSEIFLITSLPKVINFEKIKYLSKDQAKKKKFDLIISPTLNLRHFPFVFKASFWLGYFSKPKIQSNFVKESKSYDGRKEHYLLRAIKLIEVLDKNLAEKFLEGIKKKTLKYPEIILKKPAFFEEIEKPYLALAPFSFWEERQWPLSYFREVIKEILKKKLVKKIVILGGKSSWEEKKLKELLKGLESASIINLVGKTNWSETAFIIKNAEIYLGVDSGPSHLAYLLAKKVFVIFVSVNPKTIIPFIQQEGIFYFFPKACSNFPCYDGIFRPDFKKCQKCAQTISPKEVLQKIFSST